MAQGTGQTLVRKGTEDYLQDGRFADSEDIASADNTAISETMTALREQKRKKRASKRIKITLTILLVLLIAALLFFGGMQAYIDENFYDPEVQVAATQDYTESVKATGFAWPMDVYYVTPEVDGIVDEVIVKDGQAVEEGEVLLTLLNANLTENAKEAESQRDAANSTANGASDSVWNLQQSYEAAKAEYNEAIERAQNDEAHAREIADKARKDAYQSAIAAIPDDASDEERSRLLAEAESSAQVAYDSAYDSVGITAIPAFDEASYLGQIETAQATLASAKEAASNAQQAYERALESESKRIIKAPKSGTVISLSAKPGLSTAGIISSQGGEYEGLVAIADMSAMRVEMQVNEIDIDKLSIGQEAIITTAAIDGYAGKAEIASIATSASKSPESNGSMTGAITYSVQLQVADINERLKPGMTVNVEVMLHEESDVIVVPKTAIFGEDGKQYIAIVTDREHLLTEKREVTLGRSNSKEAVIEKGLNVGESFMVDGAAEQEYLNGIEDSSGNA